MSDGTARRRSPSSRKRYSPGSGASPGRYIAASFPISRSASEAARIEPSASPSGFSWPATRKRSLRRNTSATALSSACVIGRRVVDEFVDQLRHANPALDRGIVFERELRRLLQIELACDPRLQEAVRRLQTGEGGPPLTLVAEH